MSCDRLLFSFGCFLFLGFVLLFVGTLWVFRTWFDSTRVGGLEVDGE